MSQMQINKQNFASFIASLELGDNTKAMLVARLGKFLVWENYLTPEEYKEVRTLFRFSKPQWSKRALTNEDLKKFLQAVHSSFRSKETRVKYSLLCLIMAATGCRVGQITSLLFENVKTKQNKLILRFKKLKSIEYKHEEFEIKQIPLDYKIENLCLKDLLDEYMNWRMQIKSQKYFFVTNQGKKLSTNLVRQIFYKVSDKIKLRVTPHKIRHTVGTYVAQKHGIMQAAILLGHSSISTTQYYIMKENIDTSSFVPQYES